MTGLDCLRKEMKIRGCTKSQIDSSTAAIVLDILADSGNKYKELWQKEEHASERLKALEGEMYNFENQSRHLRETVTKLKNELDVLMSHKAFCQDYIDEFNKSLEECETAEGRDALRVAQMFTNSVEINTKYDNTTYIVGLASILSGEKINPITELKKINKKLSSELEIEAMNLRIKQLRTEVRYE